MLELKWKKKNTGWKASCGFSTLADITAKPRRSSADDVLTNVPGIYRRNCFLTRINQYLILFVAHLPLPSSGLGFTLIFILTTGILNSIINKPHGGLCRRGEFLPFGVWRVVLKRTWLWIENSFQLPEVIFLRQADLGLGLFSQMDDAAYHPWVKKKKI